MDQYFVYMLLCADGTYYVGISNDPDRRVAEHNIGLDEGCYTYKRRPVRMVHCSGFHEVWDAISWEKRLKKWSHAKKAALVDNDWPRIRKTVRDERLRRKRKQ